MPVMPMREWRAMAVMERWEAFQSCQRTLPDQILTRILESTSEDGAKAEMLRYSEIWGFKNVHLKVSPA